MGSTHMNWNPYEEAEKDIGSTKLEGLRKNLNIAKVPEAYKDLVSGVRVEEIR